MNTPEMKCQCAVKSCLRGGPCAKLITAEDLLCDPCRMAGLHCHELGPVTPQCEFAPSRNLFTPYPKPPIDGESWIWQ